MKSEMKVCSLLVGALLSGVACADEGLFGYVKGAEPLPKGSFDFEQWVTVRTDKGAGSYTAWDTKSELEYGITDRLATEFSFYGLGINTSGLIINNYVPKEADYAFKPAGVEASVKYNFLSAAKDDIGLSQYFALSYFWQDVNSGQRKDSYSAEAILMLQKYFLEGQLVAAGNLGLEATSATRKPINGLSEDIEWVLTPEMEIEFTASAGLTYRFAPNWFIGAEIIYQTEHETVVAQERWSLQAGPTLHYGGKNFWVTLTWLPQLAGGGLTYDNLATGEPQSNTNLHLIEKTKQEVRLKIGINF